MTPRGFTLIELLIVMGIIVVLMAILLPVISHIRMRAYEASTQSQLSRLMQACQNYYHDFNAYPGPIHNSQLSGGGPKGLGIANGAYPAPGATISNISGTITSSENLALGLLGMLTPPTTPGSTINFVSPASNPGPGTAPHDVLSLNPLHPQGYHYFDYTADELSSQTGFSKDLDYASAASTPPTDSNVPEFVDRFPDHMPILYIRAFVGGSGDPQIAATDISGPNNGAAQYNYTELKNYGSFVRQADNTGTWVLFAPMGIGPNSILYIQSQASNLADDEATPYTDWWPLGNPAAGSAYYFMNPNISGAVRGKDGFMLISSGQDRTYGTLDDIIITP
jgi:prepilin-type N-terminal cleavage/methylation domain-containing protein